MFLVSFQKAAAALRQQAAGRTVARRFLSTTTPTTPLAAYERLVTQGKIRRDDVQLNVMRIFERLHGDLADFDNVPPFWSSLFGRKPREPPRGVYVYGGVGSGKTFCMDTFYGCLDVESKQRVHFHDFMLGVHRRIHEVRKKDKGTMRDVAEEVAKKGRVLCLDELQVVDIADAMVVKTLFEHLFDDFRCVLVATSNRAPTDLYKNGIQRESFLPFIPLLESKCVVASVQASTTDYRLVKGLSGDTANVYFLLGGDGAGGGGELDDDDHDDDDDDDDKAEESFESCKRRLLAKPQLTDRVLLKTRDTGRTVPAKRADLASRAALFSFDELCGSNVGAADYLALAGAFHTIFLDNVPVMDATDLDRARRFITLVDALYDADCVLVVRAEAPPQHLFVPDKTHSSASSSSSFVKARRDEAFAFDRTASRLIEMGSSEYLRRSKKQRDPLAIDVLQRDDVDVDQLFRSLDVDGSGYLDEDELAAFLADVSELRRGHRNVPDAEVQAALLQLDTNGDGFVDLTELRQYLAQRDELMSLLG